jgi:hypothetical protein
MNKKSEPDFPIYIEDYEVSRKLQTNGSFTIGIKQGQTYDIPVNFLVVN